jgi:predicted tellurium resistance membrane protein TerC
VRAAVKNLALVFACWLLAALILTGGVHAAHEWIHAVPTITYLQALVIVMTIYSLALLYTMARKFNFNEW